MSTAAWELFALVLGKLNNPSPTAPAEVAAQWSKMMGLAKWVAFAAGALGLLAAGIMMSLGRRHRSGAAAEGAVAVPWVLAGISMAVLAVPVVNLFM